MQKSSHERSLLFAALAAALAISVSEAQLPKKGNRGNRCASWCRSPRDHCPKELCAGCVALCAQYREDITHPCPAVAKWDTAYETCLDWCRPLEESSHCGKCSCKACPSCRGGGGGSAQKPVATPTRSAAPAAAPAAASGSAAPAQAVLVRGVLARGSECEPNDSSDVATAQCELDCSLSRCQQCRCASCPFCAAGPAAPSTAPIQCAPLDNADTTVQQCAAMCQPEHASNYCKRCQCGACAFCGGSLAPPPPPPPAAAAHAPLLRPPPPPPEESRVGYSQPEAGNLLGRSRLGDGASVAWRRACEQQVNSGREVNENCARLGLAGVLSPRQQLRPAGDARGAASNSLPGALEAGAAPPPPPRPVTAYSGAYVDRLHAAAASSHRLGTMGAGATVAAGAMCAAAICCVSRRRRSASRRRGRGRSRRAAEEEYKTPGEGLYEVSGWAEAAEEKDASVLWVDDDGRRERERRRRKKKKDRYGGGGGGEGEEGASLVASDLQSAASYKTACDSSRAQVRRWGVDQGVPFHSTALQMAMEEGSEEDELD